VSSVAVTPEGLRAAAARIDAPDVVLAVSREGRRTIATGGTRNRNGSRSEVGVRDGVRDGDGIATPREELRYEIGSITKTFTGLLLARLAQEQRLDLAVPVSSYLRLRPDGDAAHETVTPFHLMTHTSGLPGLPRAFRRHVRRHRDNPFARSTHAQLTTAFARHRHRTRPGTRWRYSNFGVALIGPALTAATGASFHRLAADHVLGPLGLPRTTAAHEPDTDATGHDSSTQAPLPPFDAGAFASAGALRATPGDLLTYLEAQLDPGRHPALEGALREAQRPLLRRGLRRRDTHTLSWFCHTPGSGPLFFHSGATPGQESFIGFNPATATAVAACATRGYHRGSVLGQTAYDLLASPGPLEVPGRAGDLRQGA
jgi:CubicO group peptidase (beta-lactamase class C family)